MVTEINEKEFEKEVLQSELPAVVDFYADWCMPCKMLAPAVEAFSDEYDGRINFFKLNTDEAQEIAIRYHVMSIPTLIFFRGGEPADKTVGLVPKEEIRKKLDQMLSYASAE